MSASANSDSESGGEENCNRDDEGNQSPKSESLSRSSSPARQTPSPSQSPACASPQSPSSPRSPASPHSLSSPRSPASPHSPSSLQSPASPQSPSPRSPASPYDPEAVKRSPTSSPPPSPSSSSPRSPLSQPQSPTSANGQGSEDEVQASDVEMSDNETENHQDEDKAVTKESDEKEEVDNEDGKSDNEADCQSEAEESEHEENIPEVNIESADENEDEKQSDKENASDNEMDHSAEEDNKEDQQSVHVESDVDNKSDDDEEASANDHVQKSDSPLSPHSSPVRTEETEAAGSGEKEDIQKSDKPESEAEDNADSDSDGESDESEVGGLIADIFGESDDDEEFEGFNEDDIGSAKSAKDSPKKEKKKRATILSDSEDEDEKDDEKEKEENEEAQGIIEDVPAPPEEDVDVDVEEVEEPSKKKKKVESDDSDDDGDRKMREDFVSDFDLMMQKKKEESSKRRRRRDVDLISDSDDLIADIIAQMRLAAEEDKLLNKQKKTATKKLKILPMVMSQLKKQDLKTAFLDQGILNVIAEWLTPLPDRSLPHFNIREGMLKQLSDLPPFDQSLLKSSGIGRALMYLYKHPRESKENREKAGRLITEWARPIFNVTTNYHSLTKEEREQRDYDHVPKKRKLRDHEAEEEEAARDRKDIEKEMDGDKTAIRPGDKGWIGRARVPMPSTKDYVNRPKWNVEMEFGRGPSKKPLTRIEKHMKTLQDKKRLNKQQRAITISVEGRKMAI